MSKLSPPPTYNVDNWVSFSLFVGRNAIFSNVDKGGWGICDPAQLSQLLLSGIVGSYVVMYQSNQSFNIPPAPWATPRDLNFWKIFVQIPPSRGRKAVQMHHHRSIPGDQMPSPPGNFSVAFIMLRKLCM